MTKIEKHLGTFYKLSWALLLSVSKLSLLSETNHSSSSLTRPSPYVNASSDFSESNKNTFLVAHAFHIIATVTEKNA